MPMDQPVTHRRVARISAFVGICGVILVSVLVGSGATQHLDVTVRDLFRPDDVWGDAQVRMVPIVDAFAPPRMFALLALVAVARAVHDRSARPVVQAVLLVGCSVALTGAFKFIVHRPDPHGEMTATGGSFPSGHMVSLIVCLGGSLLIWGIANRWYAWIPVVVLAVGMGLALLYGSAHWLTDVVGGALLALGVLGGASLVLQGSTAAERSVVHAGHDLG
jgi:membrane-associated phospholipid phosphatase